MLVMRNSVSMIVLSLLAADRKDEMQTELSGIGTASFFFFNSLFNIFQIV